MGYYVITTEEPSGIKPDSKKMEDVHYSATGKNAEDHITALIRYGYAQSCIKVFREHDEVRVKTEINAKLV